VVFINSRRRKGNNKKLFFLNEGGALGSKEGFKSAYKVNKIIFYYSSTA
jgi:hypothetical protein